MKYLYYFTILIFLVFISCNNKKTQIDKQSSDSIITLNMMVLSLKDSIESLNKNLNLKGSFIDKMEVIKLNDIAGRDLYVKNCKFCHGDLGRGDGIKSRVDTLLCPHDLTLEDIPDQDIYFIILNGLNNMPSQFNKLNDDEIWLLVVYVKKLK